MAENPVFRHKAQQYDAVVEALHVCDGGRYRADTIESVLGAVRELSELRKDKARLAGELRHTRRGLQNILEFRKIAGSDRYGLLTREEVESVIALIDKVLEEAHA